MNDDRSRFQPEQNRFLVRICPRVAIRLTRASRANYTGTIVEHSVRAIETTRLRLIPTTVALARAEISNRGEFARLLEATVPDNWPPECIANALSLFLGWLSRLRIAAGSVGTALAAAGFGPAPSCWQWRLHWTAENGSVDIGYRSSLNPRDRASRLRWWRTPRWRSGGRVLSAWRPQTEWANTASVRMLTKVRFIPVGLATTPTGTRFEYETNRMKLWDDSGSRFTAPSQRAQAGVYITAVNVAAPVPSAEEHYGSLKRVGRVMGHYGTPLVRLSGTIVRLACRIIGIHVGSSNTA